MPTPAHFAIFSSDASTPQVANASAATSSSRSRLRHASARWARAITAASPPSAVENTSRILLDKAEAASGMFSGGGIRLGPKRKPHPHDSQGLSRTPGLARNRKAHHDDL